jgi:polysaccharide export outer membrane protein
MKNQNSTTKIFARFGLVAFAVVLSAIVASGQTQDDSGATSQLLERPESRPEDLYRIGVGDVLDVRVYNRPQLSREVARVDNRGFIRMPLIESEIEAGCRTEVELAHQIEELYLKYLKRPHVDVFIKEYNSKPVAVIGAVSKPGQFQLQRRVTVLELISLAGGPTEHAGERIFVSHANDSFGCRQPGESDPETEFASYSFSSLVRDGKANSYVFPGDVITIPEAEQVFVVGEVFKPAVIPLKDRITLSQAIAMAGGTLSDAQKSRVRLLRQSPTSVEKVDLVFDLDSINRHQASDPVLQANDVVEVPTSKGKRMIRGLLSAVAPGFSTIPLRVVR